MSEPRAQTPQTPRIKGLPQIEGESIGKQLSRALAELRKGGVLVLKVKKRALLEILPDINARRWWQWQMLRQAIESQKKKDLSSGRWLYVWIGYSNGQYPEDTEGWPYYYMIVSTHYSGGRLYPHIIMLDTATEVSWLTRALQQHDLVHAIRKAVPREKAEEPLGKLAQALYEAVDRDHHAINRLVSMLQYIAAANVNREGLYTILRIVRASASARYIRRKERLPPEWL